MWCKCSPFKHEAVPNYELIWRESDNRVRQHQSSLVLASTLPRCKQVVWTIFVWLLFEDFHVKIIPKVNFKNKMCLKVKQMVWNLRWDSKISRRDTAVSFQQKCAQGVIWQEKQILLSNLFLHFYSQIEQTSVHNLQNGKLCWYIDHINRLNEKKGREFPEMPQERNGDNFVMGVPPLVVVHKICQNLSRSRFLFLFFLVNPACSDWWCCAWVQKNMFSSVDSGSFHS